jgi:intracellular septation protein A
VSGLLQAGRALLLDMAATLFFLLLYALTHDLTLSVGLGLALALGRIGWLVARHKPVDTLQWVSLFVVGASGTATLITHNPVFVMLKPSLIYAVVGAAMLKRGWLNRYLPPVALETVSDMAIVFGYVWAGLMFFSAALNIFIALHYPVIVWGAFMSLYGMVSKLGMFVIQYAAMRTVGVRRYRAGPEQIAA